VEILLVSMGTSTEVFIEAGHVAVCGFRRMVFSANCAILKPPHSTDLLDVVVLGIRLVLIKL
jgi:hypothetical protein